MGKCAFCGAPTTGRNRTCGSIECFRKQQEGWFEGQILVPEGYLTATQFAKRKGISVQAVSKNCRNGKYEGAFQDPQSGRWYVPADS